jgi:hypothetical protein
MRNAVVMALVCVDGSAAAQASSATPPVLMQHTSM